MKMADDNRKRRILTTALLLAPLHQSAVCESDDDDYDETSGAAKRRKSTAVEGYAEDIVPAMSDAEFRSHFRLTRGTFNDVVARLDKYMSNDNSSTCGPHPIPIYKQLLVAIQMLANQDPYRSIANLFGISRSTAWQILQRVCDALLELNKHEDVISWPRGQHAVDIVDGFLSTYGFPGVIGAVDGSHIPIKAPVDNHASYINRKGFHSIVLQAVCDNRMLFTDCYVGEVGSVHDACVLRRSDLCAQMSSDATMLPPDTHILGDPAYPLLQNLMVPFKDDGRLDARKRHYNQTLSAARSVIERAFALLKGRFRRLKYVDMTRTDLVPKVVMSCCVLHNICIRGGDVCDDDDDDGSDSRDDGGMSDHPDTAAHGRSGASAVAVRQVAVAKRELLCCRLST